MTLSIIFVYSIQEMWLTFLFILEVRIRKCFYRILLMLFPPINRSRLFFLHIWADLFWLKSFHSVYNMQIDNFNSSYNNVKHTLVHVSLWSLHKFLNNAHFVWRRMRGVVSKMLIIIIMCRLLFNNLFSFSKTEISNRSLHSEKLAIFQLGRVSLTMENHVYFIYRNMVRNCFLILKKSLVFVVMTFKNRLADGGNNKN